MTFGLAWDVTNGVNIDLDASAICLNSSLAKVDIVWFRKLTSDDRAIQHSGDEREGDEVGDDEKIQIQLGDINPEIKHIAFVINSFSGQELDDIRLAACHLFDPTTGVEIAKYKLSNNVAIVTTVAFHSHITYCKKKHLRRIRTHDRHTTARL